MKVFISWSGERSRRVAEAVRAWLPRVIQSVRPWMSQEDISAGSRWLAEVSTVLDASQVGILCVTPENQHNPWLLFEAGSLSKSLTQSRVCPLLFDITPGQLSGPLTQFQAYEISQEGMSRVLASLNLELGEARLAEGELDEILQVWWPHLERQIEAIGPVAAPAEVRSTQEQLDELLTLARENIRRENVRLDASKNKDERMEHILRMMDESMSVMTSMQKSAKKMQGSVKETFGAILEKIERHEIAPEAAVKEMVEATFTTPHSMPQLDLKSLKEMRTLMADLEAEHRKHVQQIIAPLEDDSATQKQS